MAYVKVRRLEKAHDLLRENPDLSIAAVAHRCGFGGNRHFASDYRRLFGETPSATARRSRLSRLE